MRKTLFVRGLTVTSCLLIFTQVLAVEINFAPPIKIGDGQSNIPTYGPGNQIVFNGNELEVAWAAQDPVPLDPTKHWSKPYEIRHLRSNDSGESWEYSDVITRGDDSNGGYNYMQGVSLALGSHEGTAYKHYAFGYGNKVFYVNDRSRTPINVTGTLGLSADDLSRSIAADQSGNVFVCFGVDGRVYCSRFFTDEFGEVSLDIAETASLASGSGSSPAIVEPAIAMDSSGTLFGVWTEKFDGVQELVLAKRVASGTWEYHTVDRLGYETRGDNVSFAIADVAGTTKICVSWAWNEVVVSCTDDEGASWNTSVVLSDEWADWRPSVAIASDGVVNIAWAKQNSVKFARELKDKKDSKWEVVEVDTQSCCNVMDVKLALDDKDLAHLIYPGKWWTTVMYTNTGNSNFTPRAIDEDRRAAFFERPFS
jgi:hypothetical protein